MSSTALESEAAGVSATRDAQEEGPVLARDIRVSGLAVMVAVAALASDGCEDAPRAERGAAFSAREIQRAFAERRYGDLCALLTRRAQVLAGSSGHQVPSRCERDVRARLTEVRVGAGWRTDPPRVIGATVDGSRATVLLRPARGGRLALPFAREGGVWKLDGFFGSHDGLAKRFPATAATDTIASDNRTRIAATGGANRRPCRRVRRKAFPVLRGGCIIRFATSAPARFDVTTIFGDFVFARCDVEYRIRVEGDGRAWVDVFEAHEPAGADQPGCGDVNRCFVDPDDPSPDHDDMLPLPGRLGAVKAGRFALRTDVCLRTCIGVYAGRLELLSPARPLLRRMDARRSPVGASGFSIAGRFVTARPGLRISVTRQ